MWPTYIFFKNEKNGIYSRSYYFDLDKCGVLINKTFFVFLNISYHMHYVPSFVMVFVFQWEMGND